MAKAAFLPIVWLAAAATTASSGSRIDGGPRCEPIKIDMCKSIGYNMTGMPNLARNTLQTDAMFDLGAYSLLILLGCANELQFFLCSVYAPVCVNDESNAIPQTLIGPCRPLCERVKRGCLGFFRDFNMKWPAVLECEKFPSTNIHDHMCMEGPGEMSSPPPQLTSSLMNTMQANPFLINEVRRQLAKGIKHTEKYKTYKRFFDLFEDATATNELKKCSELKKPEVYRFVERTGKCEAECSAHISFTEEDKKFSRHWIIILAVLSIFLSFVSLITLLVDNHCRQIARLSLVSFSSRSPPVFLTFCCFMYSLGYLISQILPRETFCIGELAGYEGHRNLPCVVVFILTYFFGVAGSGWWTVSSISWFLSLLEPKRAPLGPQTVSTMCHAAAWLPAAILTITAIITGQVEPDELSSVCLPGGATKDVGILAFILIPESTYLFIGCVFYVIAIVMAFIGHPSVDNDMELRPRRRRTLDLKKLRARMGVFGILYLLPKLCYLVTVVYEYMYRSLWLDASQQWLPKMEIFMLRIFATLFIGMSCLWWIWRKDIVASWGNCCQNSCSGSPKVETPPPNFYPNYPYHPQPQIDPNNITVIQDSSYQS